MSETTEKLNDADQSRSAVCRATLTWLGFNQVLVVLYLGFFNPD